MSNTCNTLNEYFKQPKDKTKELLLGETCITCINYDPETKRCFKYGPYITSSGSPLPEGNHCNLWASRAEKEKK